MWRCLGVQGFVDGVGSGLAEDVRYHCGQIVQLWHGAEGRADGSPLASHIRRRQRDALPGLEHQLLRPIADHGQPLPERCGGEGGDGDDAPVLGLLGVVLTDDPELAPEDQRAGHGHCHRCRIGEVEVTPTDSQRLTNAGAGAQHDVEQLLELPVRFGSHHRSGAPLGDRVTNLAALLRAEDADLPVRARQRGGLRDRVQPQGVVPHGQSQDLGETTLAFLARETCAAARRLR